MNEATDTCDVQRIREALDVASGMLLKANAQRKSVDYKRNGHPVTEADRAVDAALRELLCEPGDGWLSEETVDDGSRLEASRVWIVDPQGSRSWIFAVTRCGSITPGPG